jgi:hypothetical protein
MNIEQRYYPFYWVAISVMVIVLDFLTGPAIQFPVVFVVPVALAAWYSGRKWGLAIAILLAIARSVMYLYWATPESGFIIAANLIIRASVLVGIVYMVDYTASLNREVRTLKGILPICSNCKRIRAADGAWRRMEVYISERTDAEFSHGLCEECAAKLYPKYFKRNSENVSDRYS